MFAKNATQVMIDLETLSTEPQAIILSIGATSFSIDHEGVDKFYVVCPKEEQHRDGRKISASTSNWWNAQGSEAQEVLRLSEACSDSMRDCLDGLSAFLGSFAKPYVWGLGAIMDIATLEDAYRQYNMPIPWTYKQPMCFRTLREMFGAEVPAPDFLGTRHNAMDDATYQAMHLKMILDYVSEKGDK